ncbi:E3 ubiquitin-protein ligase NEDD4 [Cricetulus griseus]|uniref:E3 ubiquitin-protein ligase NEDD4 n=1 Tax=Cricetulus griseus TaxID=10029 RepID=G3HCC6_CRIGR|nr:E3 ubiquitin-protein ligase NEDD4 [Cricetulus griseus]
MPAGQKRAQDLIRDGCEPPCGCWELNSGPLEEQSVLLTSESSLQPPKPEYEWVQVIRLFFHNINEKFILLDFFSSKKRPSYKHR